MHGSSNRSILIISGLLTLLVLSGGALALGFHNGWLRSGSGAATPEAIGADSQPSDARNDGAAPIGAKPSAVGSTQTTSQDEAAVYRQKLDDAYRALDDAYAQIRVLQAPQVRLASSDDSDERDIGHDGHDDGRERRSRRHDSDDH
jgi:hypothetical protein